MGERGRGATPPVDPEAVVELVRQGHSVSKACEKLGIKYQLVQSWQRRGKFNLTERFRDARAIYAKKLAQDSAAAFPDKARPKQLQAFLDNFRRTGEQIPSCRYAGITYQQFKEFCDPANIHYNWWFATEFEALLEEQLQELRDKAISGALQDGKSAAQLLRDIERVQKPPSKSDDGDGSSISDDQILEALTKISEKIRAAELSSEESELVQVAPS